MFEAISMFDVESEVIDVSDISDESLVSLIEVETVYDE